MWIWLFDNKMTCCELRQVMQQMNTKVNHNLIKFHIDQPSDYVANLWIKHV